MPWSVEVKPDRSRSEVLAVTAKILAYRRENKGNGKKRSRFQNDEGNRAVREYLEQYEELR